MYVIFKKEKEAYQSPISEWFIAITDKVWLLIVPRSEADVDSCSLSSFCLICRDNKRADLRNGWIDSNSAWCLLCVSITYSDASFNEVSIPTFFNDRSPEERYLRQRLNIAIIVYALDAVTGASTCPRLYLSPYGLKVPVQGPGVKTRRRRHFVFVCF